MRIEPIARRKVYELVADRLLQEITEHRLKPGDTLPPERVLAEAYAVGRSSVREALRILESKGLIVATGRSTFTVAGRANPLDQSLSLLMAMNGGDLWELFEVRRILEVEAAGLAAMRRTEADLAEMEAAIQEMVEGLGSQERYASGDLRFHLAVAQATHNRIASHMMQAIRAVLHRTLMWIYLVPGSPERSNADHRRIAEAIRARDADAARARMRGHLARVEAESREARKQPAGPEGPAAGRVVS